MIVSEYKKEISAARQFENIGVLALLYEAAKEDFYNDKLTANEYNELRKMILGL